MSSSRTIRQQETRERLLSATARVIAERGYAQATIDQIAVEAGFTKGAVYANFASKEALLLALLDRYEDHWVAAYGELLLSADPDAIADTKLVDDEDDRVWTLLERELWLLAMRSDEARTRLIDRYQRTRLGLAQRLAERDGRSAVEASDIERATLLMALDIGLAAQGLLDPTVVPSSVVARATAAVLAPVAHEAA
jgi:AcrR family transcriptional regulator